MVRSRQGNIIRFSKNVDLSGEEENQALFDGLAKNREGLGVVVNSADSKGEGEDIENWDR